MDHKQPKPQAIEKHETPATIAGSILEFSESLRQFGGSQKFVVLKSPAGFYFGTKDGDHPNIMKKLQEQFGENLESAGGGFLRLFGNEITLQDGSHSFNLGPLHIHWSELKEMLQEHLGADFVVTISE